MIDTEKYQPARQNMKKQAVTKSVGDDFDHVVQFTKMADSFEVDFAFGLFCRIYAVKGKEISIFLQI